MKFAAIIALFLSTLQVFSQGRIIRTDGMCAAQGSVAPGQLIDTVINLKILLVQFADVGCRKDTDGVEPRYRAQDFEDLLGSYGIYASPGMRSPDGDELFGSMNDYYMMMSGGRMSIHASVINSREGLHGKPVWVTLGQRKQDYQATDNAVFSDAVDEAYRQGLDPSLSDNTRLVIIYAGNTWFLQGGLNPKAWGFIYIMSEVQGRPYNQELPGAKFSRIGIHCHEFAHTLGIGHSTGGRADVMYGGTSNGSVEGNAPAPFNAIVRARMGWANVIPVESVNSQGTDVSYSLANPTVYVMKNSQGGLFYIENRRFDQSMTIGRTAVPDYNNAKFFPPAWPHNAITQGIFVWRVNTIGDDLDPGYSTEGLVYASGRYGRTYPENGPSDTDDGVPFPGVSNNKLFSPWSDPRNPYIKETDYFGSASTHYSLFVPNSKGGSNCGMEVLSEDRPGGTFRVRFYASNPPNPALIHQPGPDSIGSYDSRRTIVSLDSGVIHQTMEVGGEIFYRRSTNSGMSWSVPSLLSQGSGGNSAPCITLAGPALLVAWQMDAYDAADTGRVILLSRSTDAGKSWSAYVSAGWSYRCGAPGAYPSLAGAKDGSAMLVYRADRSSLVSTVSRDAGLSWSDPSPLPVGDISWNTPSLAMKDISPEALIAYAGSSLSGSATVLYDRFAIGSGGWGSPVPVSGIVTPGYVGFRNPDLVAAAPGASASLNVAWDASDTYSGVPVIISRRVDIALLGSSYSVFKGASQNDLSVSQLPLSISGKPARSYARVLTMMDSTSGASVSIEIGVIRLVHRGGKVDTIRLSDSPSDSLMLDVAGLIDAGRSSAFSLGTDADTLQVVAAMFGRNPSSLFADGHVGFEIVGAGNESVIAQFGVESAASVPNGARRLTLLSIPVSCISLSGSAGSVVIHPFVAGLKKDARLTASLAHVFSNLSESPVDRVLSAVGGSVSRANTPNSFALEQNFPNPFNPSTTIRFALSQTSPVMLIVYNALGQEVATLVHGELEAGTHEIRFDGGRLASGMYIYTLRAGNSVAAKKLLLLR